jgi:NADH-quinone oxidoreductase subunit E
LKDKLGVDVHETSADGKFTLLAMECLGSCDNAPCALVNGKQYNNLSVSMVDEIINKLSKE